MKEPTRRKLNHDSVENKNVKGIPMPPLKGIDIDITDRASYYYSLYPIENNNETHTESNKT